MSARQRFVLAVEQQPCCALDDVPSYVAGERCGGAGLLGPSVIQQRHPQCTRGAHPCTCFVGIIWASAAQCDVCALVLW